MTLPDFLIIGAQRCGTSSLIRYLADHPRIVPPTKWEVHFFDFDNWRNGVDWYSKQLGKRGPDTVHGEKSPGYMAMPRAPRRIRQVCPDAKFIVMLRDPVERAYSQYRLRCNLDRESMCFGAAIKHALRERRDWSNWLGYLRRGHYAEQLAHWFEFFPRAQFHIIQSESFYDDERSAYDEVLDFLGLPHHVINVFKRHGRVHQHGRCPESSLHGMSDETRQLLTDYYQSHNARLYDLLGRDFGWQ